MRCDYLRNIARIFYNLIYQSIENHCYIFSSIYNIVTVRNI